MPKMGIVGPSYTSQSANANDQMTMNLYVESMEGNQAENPIVLYPTPGTRVFTTLADLPVRGQVFTATRAFAVGGSVFHEIFADGTNHNYGVIANDDHPVSMAAGTSQILIASAGACYVFDLNANSFTPIPPATLANVAGVGYCDGFFLAFFLDSNSFQASSPLDATSWPSLSVTTENVFIDNVLAMLVDHREVCLFGTTKTVIYYDSGNSPFPFDVVPGGFIEQGIGAPHSVVRLDNSILWLGGDERGNVVAWRAQGYTPSRVSNHAVEFAWQGYSVNSDAIGYSYQDQGHAFWVLYFPTANKTWVYDVATNMWHERGYWNAINGIYTAHRSQNHQFVFGKHLVGDWASGKIYDMSIAYLDDSENPIRRVRRAVHVAKSQEWVFHHQLQIYVQSGVGPIPALTTTSESPQSIYLADALNNIWTITVNDAGNLITTAGGSGPAQTLILNDNAANATWQIGVTIGGLLTTTSIAYNAVYPQVFPMATSPSQFQTSIQVGSGSLETDMPIAVTRGPLLNLRWSNDGGHQWSNEYSVDIGQTGEYEKRAIWRRLGRARNRVYELNYSDPAPLRIIDDNLEAS